MTVPSVVAEKTSAVEVTPSAVRTPDVVKPPVRDMVDDPSAFLTPDVVNVSESDIVDVPLVDLKPVVVKPSVSDTVLEPNVFLTPEVVKLSVSAVDVAPVSMMDLKPITIPNARDEVVFVVQVIVPVPTEPAELRPVFALSEISIVWPVPDVVPASTRSVKFVTVEVPTVSRIFIVIAIAIELLTSVVKAGIVVVVVSVASSTVTIVPPSSVSVMFA